MNRSHHSVFSLQAHLVLVTKYRRKVLREELRVFLQELFEELLKKWRCRLLEFGGEEDHVHLLLDLRPDVQPSKLVNNLKTVSSRRLRRVYEEELTRCYRKPVVWSRSYCLVSCGGASLGSVERVHPRTRQQKVAQAIVKKVEEALALIPHQIWPVGPFDSGGGLPAPLGSDRPRTTYLVCCDAVNSLCCNALHCVAVCCNMLYFSPFVFWVRH